MLNLRKSPRTKPRENARQNTGKKRLVIFFALGAFLSLAMSPASASAATIDFDQTGTIDAGPASDSFILDMRLTLEPGENPNVFTWSLQCFGCVITHYSDYVSQPGYFPTQVDWTGNGTNDFADSLFGDDFQGPPASPQTTPGTTVGPIGTLKISGNFTGQGNTVTVGYVTVHATSAAGFVSVYLNPASDGFFCGIPACTFPINTGFVSFFVVPEPGTAALVAFGLAGLGMTRRGSRR